MEVYIARTSAFLCQGWHNYEVRDIIAKIIDLNIQGEKYNGVKTNQIRW